MLPARTHGAFCLNPQPSSSMGIGSNVEAMSSVKAQESGSFTQLVFVDETEHLAAHIPLSGLSAVLHILQEWVGHCLLRVATCPQRLQLFAGTTATWGKMHWIHETLLSRVSVKFQHKPMWNLKSASDLQPSSAPLSPCVTDTQHTCTSVWMHVFLKRNILNSAKPLHSLLSQQRMNYISPIETQHFLQLKNK